MPTVLPGAPRPWCTLTIARASVVALVACAGPAAIEPPAVSPHHVPLPVAAPEVAFADTLHGVVVPDPYRFLEDTADARTQRFVADQERFAAAVLARVVARDSLTAHFARALQGAPTLGQVLETTEGLLLMRWLGDAPSLHAALEGASSERTVRRAEAEGTIRALSPSFDGRLVAVGRTAAGDEAAAIEVRDVRTGRVLPETIDDLLTTTSATRYRVHWLAADDGSSRGFFYPRLWPATAPRPANDRLARSRQFLHRLGTPRARDLAVFGYGVSPDVPMHPDDLAARVLSAPGSRWLIGTVYRVQEGGNEHYVARRTPGDATVPAWHPLLSIIDEVSYPQLVGDTVYALTRRDADRGRLVQRVLGDGAVPGGAWEVLVPQRRGVITDFRAQADGLYFTVREGGALALHVLRKGARAPEAVPLPLAGTITLAHRSPAMAGVLFSVESWAAPPRWFRATDGGRTVDALALDDGGTSGASATVVSDRLGAPSADGTTVPVSFVYDTAAMRAAFGGVRTRTAPVLLEAYGGFAQSTDPAYDPTIAAWTALGGLYAYAHVRGGGELGEAWHLAGVRDGKRHGVADVIAAAEALVARGYTAPGRVALQGISFGAGIAGIAPLERPGLFGAVLFDVGGPDEVRALALDPTAARNVGELGDTASAEGVRLLVRASPYHRVPARAALPAMLVHSARDDYNFGTEMLVAKYVARLQAANGGTRPVVWVRTPGGHRWLRSLSSQWAATVASFLLWHTGDARFQPAGR